MNVLIFGGTGFLGSKLVKHFLDKAYRVYIVTRDQSIRSDQLGKRVTFIEWNYTKPFKMNLSNEIDIVINLAGDSLAKKRWTRKVKKEIIDSRILTARRIVQAINDRVLKPVLFINASAVGYYGDRGDLVITENAKPAVGFLSQVCQQWESEAEKIDITAIHTVLLRTAIVLGKGGILKTMILPFRLLLGGVLGNGNQWMSWIHIEDFVNAIEYIIAESDISGPVNLASPNPVTNREFTKILGKIIRRPVIFRIPKLLLKILLGEKSQLVLDSQRVVPEKLISAGFQFSHPDLESALSSLLLK